MLKITIVPVTPVRQNCAILYDDQTRRGVVVDPGGDIPDILAAIDAAGVTVERILLTHGHFDHVGGVVDLLAALAARGSPAPEVLGPDVRDQPLIDGLEEQGRMFGFEGLQGFTPDRHLAHGETVDIGGQPFEVRHAPGHSPGHVVFIAPGEKLAILGDTLFHNSIGRTDFPYADPDTLMASLRTQVLTLPDATPFLCGHGPTSTIGAERRDNPFLR